MTDFAAINGQHSPGLDSEVLLVRDSWGIPHVRAGSAPDAWFAMGYACAQDRLFQMDYDRRRAAGRWAEVAGPAAVPGDVLARRMNLTEAARADVALMSEPVRAMFEAYAHGVNAWLASGAPPTEPSGTDLRPAGDKLAGTAIEPWQPWHSVAAFKVRHILMGQWQHKLAEATVLARAGADALRRLDTRSPAGSPLSVPPGRRLAQVIAEAAGDIERAAPHLGFLAEAEPGSNAWAVSGRRTAHGGAVLCNDSHRALESPNVYWQCHLSCPEFNVIGAAFPGVPGFPHFGHNGRVAWAITHGSADTQDLYLEWFDPARPGWYRTVDGWEEATRRTETIDVRDGEPLAIEVWATRHGQVVHGDPLAGMALALKCTITYRGGRGFEPLLPMLAAGDVVELIDAQRDWVDPVNNLVAADTGGRVAYQARGELPVRSSDAHRRLPVPGWDGECEWTGTVSFVRMPRVVDPEGGFVLTANNVITEGDDPFISYTFSQPFRAERLRRWLTATDRHTVDGLAALQSDVVSVAAQSWSRLLDGLAPLPEQPAERARLMLAAWTGELDASSPAALLYGCFQRELAEALYRPALGDATWRWLTSRELPPSDTIIRRALASDTWDLPGFPGAARDPAKAEQVLAVLPAALAAAWRRATQTGDPSQWRWADAHQARALHPLSGQPVPHAVGMGGDADTIQASAYGWQSDKPFDVTVLSVYRQVVDMANPAAASFVIPGGASGDPHSPHFADQLTEWAAHRRVPMLFDWPQVEAAARSTTLLKPSVR